MINEWQQDSLPVASTDLLNYPPAWSDHPAYRTYSFGVNTPSGVRVSPETALLLPVIAACVTRLAFTTAGLPIRVYKESADGSKITDSKHEVYRLLATKKGRPNSWQTGYGFRQMLTMHLALRGNAYAEIIANNGGGIESLEPIHPDRVEPERLENGRLRYKLRAMGDLPERMLTQDEVLHLRWMSSDGIEGLSPITLAAKSIGLAQAAETHGSALFKNGARPGGILKHPNKLPPGAAEQLKAEWDKFYSGAGKAHNVAVVEGGMEFHEIGITPEDAQYLETRKFQAEDIARIYGMPPHMVGIMDHATFTNIEHQSTEFIKYTMDPWLKEWEASVDRDLIIEEDYVFEHNVDGLLRGDSEARFNQYSIGLDKMIYTRNEVRKMENLPPVAGGDEFQQPLNMVPEGSQQQDATDDDQEDTPEESQAFARMLADASKRIASAELRELEKRAKHATADPEKFGAWVNEYYTGKYRDYVSQTVTPIYEAFEATGLNQAVQTVIVDGMVTLSTSSAEDVLEDWKTSRATALTNILKEKAHV